MNSNQTCNITEPPIYIQYGCVTALSLLNWPGVNSWMKRTVKTDNTMCSLTAWERRHWGQTWETPAGTILLPETTEVPCLPSLQRFNNNEIHRESEHEHNQARARQWSCTANILHCLANLELSEISRAATADSAGLSQPHIPTLFLISPHNDLAGGGNGLKDRKKQGFYRWHISSIPTVGCAVCLQAAPQVK